MQDAKIVFLHIPKTGGQTLRKIAESNYSEDERFACYPSNPKYPGLEELLGLPSERKDKLRLISGHLDFGYHELADYPCVYFAMMRDPVERVLSAYQHILRRNPKCEGFSLLKIFESKRVLLDNHQTRILSGESPAFDKCNEDMVWKAMENIDKHFAFVGVNERYQESVAVFARMFGWLVTEAESINVTPSKRERETFSKYEIEKIRWHNRFDLMLYSHVMHKVEAETRELAATG